VGWSVASSWPAADGLGAVGSWRGGSVAVGWATLVAATPRISTTRVGKDSSVGGGVGVAGTSRTTALVGLGAVALG
jgi:hypothetical protein